MNIGELYPIGSWLYVPELETWFQVDDEYRREADELPEQEANKLGIVRGESV